MRSKRAILNVMWALALQVVTVICGFIVPKYIISAYGSEVNGLVSSITQFLGYIVLLEAGFGPVVKAALYKPIANKNKQEIENILKASEKFFRVISVIFVIYIIILAFVYPLIVNTEFSFIYIMSLVVIISISTLAEYYFGITYKLYLQADQRNYITSVIQIAGYILNTISMVVLIKFNASIHVVRIVGGLIFVLRPIAQNIYVKKKYKINLKDADKDYTLKQKWDGLAQHIASVIHSNTDIIILTLFSNMAEVSVYSVYYLVVRGIKSLMQSFIGGIDSYFGDMIAKQENKQIDRNYSVFEVFYFTIATVVFATTMILITPFIKVYTQGITDTNYIRYTFGYLLVISEFIWSIRQPYNELVKAGGHFKETQIGAWLEAGINIIISLILVNKFGIVGVAIGTIIAMLFRTVEFVYYTSKHVLYRKVWISTKKILIVVLQTLIILCIMHYVPSAEIISYKSWIIQALITLAISGVVVLGMNLVIYKKEMGAIFDLVKTNLKHGK